MTGDRDLTDAQWELIEPLLPSTNGKRSRPFRDHRPLINGIIYRHRTGCPWRDVPERYGPWRAIWRRHSQLSSRGIWDQVPVALLSRADAAGQVHLGGQRGQHHRAGPPARRDASPPGRPDGAQPHRGLGRITRIRRPSQLIMRSVGPAAG